MLNCDNCGKELPIETFSELDILSKNGNSYHQKQWRCSSCSKTTTRKYDLQPPPTEGNI